MVAFPLVVVTWGRPFKTMLFIDQSPGALSADRSRRFIALGLY